MVYRRRVPLKPGFLDSLRGHAHALRSIQEHVPVFGADFKDLNLALDALDRVGWRVEGRPLLDRAAGSSALTALRRLVQIEEVGEIYYGSYQRLGEDSLAVDSPYGDSVVRTRGRTETDAAQRSLRQIVNDHLAVIEQGWRKI